MSYGSEQELLIQLIIVGTAIFSYRMSLMYTHRRACANMMIFAWLFQKVNLFIKMYLLADEVISE